MRLGTLLRRAGVTAACAVGLVGLAHAPFARGLLMRVGGCPVGMASAAGVENARMVGVRATRGPTPAPSRPALGFELDRTTRGEVLAWAKTNGVSCRSAVEDMKMTCRDVPAAALGRRDFGAAEVTFGFRPARDGRPEALVNLSAVTTGLEPAVAATRATTASEALVTVLGAPSSGDPRVDAAFLAKGGYATAHLAFAFTDYMSEVTATSIEGRGVLLREHYMSAVE